MIVVCTLNGGTGGGLNVLARSAFEARFVCGFC